MTRSNAREIAVQLAFELSFSNETADQLLETAMTRSIFALLGEETPLYAEFPNEKQRGYIETLVRGVYLHCAELDEYISRYAIGWEFSRLPRISIAIMRVAMYEILYMQDVPNAAAINEAVELAKHYEDQDMVSFINGILGSFVRRESIPERAPVMAEGIFEAESEQGEQ
jgi:N utilization substance protein B